MRRLHHALLFLFFALAGALHAQIDTSEIREYDARRFSQYDTLAAHYEEKISSCNGCADTTLGKLYLELVHAYQYDNRSVEAFVSLEKAKEYIEKTKHITLKAELLISYAEYFRVAAQYTKALGYLEEVYQLIQVSTVQKKTVARYYGRKAAIAMEYFIDYNGALLYSQECLRIGREIKDNALIATALNEIAYVQDNRDDSSALENFMTAYQLMLGETRLLDACNMLANYVHYLVKRDQFDRATDWALQGFAMAVENNFERATSIFATDLLKIYTFKKDHEKALFYLRVKYEVEESLHKKIWGRTVSELEKKYDLQRKEEQIELSQLKIANQELELKRERASRNSIILSLVLMAILLGVVGYYFYRSNRNNKKLERLLKENQFLLGESNHRIKNNLQLISALTYQELKKKYPKEGTQGLLAISAKIEAISTLHKQLYLTESKETIRIDTYLEEIRANFHVIQEKQNIEMDFEVEALELSIHSATYIGLLCTELLLNSLKHAFNDEVDTPRIHIILRRQNGKLFLSYSDNGSGIKDKNSKLQLIDLISGQLRFHYHLKNDAGFYFETSDLA